MLTLDCIYRASFALKNVIRRTDLIYAPQINNESQVYLKPENLQYTGSFKLRGACYKISCLTEEEKARGVIACSAGNHAQGVALGATKHGIKSLICLPEGAPISKVEATKRTGLRYVWFQVFMMMLTRRLCSLRRKEDILSFILLMMNMSLPDREQSDWNC